MSRLQVEVENFTFAARTMHQAIGESVRSTMQGLTGTLQANTDLVGQDPSGSSWAAGYDPAARSVLDATAQIVNAAFATSQLFAQSGANYAKAEAASTAGGTQAGHGELTRLAGPQPIVRAPRLPGSTGAGNGTPSGWWIVENTVGYVWPGGHQDRLRATAQGWRQAAGGIENVSFEPVLINARFATDRLPEADDIGKVCGGFNTRLEDLARGYRSLGRACDEYADALDECHEAVRSELTELLAESAGIQVVGAIASVFSFGLAQAPTQATQAARIAAVAARIGTLIEKVLAVARRIGEAVGRLAPEATRIARDASRLAKARLSEAALRQARTRHAVNEIGELAATGRLAAFAKPIDRLTISATQCAKKFKHAKAFGVTAKQSKAGFIEFERELEKFVSSPTTVRVPGRYRGGEVILNYDRTSRLMIVQSLNGEFLTCWKMSAQQTWNVIVRRSVGGG